MVLTALFAVASPAMPGLHAADGVLDGAATAVDGQTLIVAGSRIALHGVMAPPLDLSCRTKRGKPYPCGRLARQALADMVENQRVECRLTMERAVARCQVGPLSINELMVLSGRALAHPDADAQYLRAQRSAQLLGEGLWKGRYPPPDEWRR